MVMKRLSAKLTGYASKECHEPLQSEKFLSDFGQSYFAQEHIAHKTGPTKEKPPPASEGSFLMTPSAEKRARHIEFKSLDSILAILYSVSSAVCGRSTLENE
jgi:hypothetical protein